MWKKLAFLALLAAAVAALVRVLRPQPDFAGTEPGTAEWPPLDLTGTESAAASSSETWCESDADGNCPDDFPVKVKLSSGIFHLPGGLNYERTKADRCYTDAAAAEADGFRKSRR
jgi:hypothetical protein